MPSTEVATYGLIANANVNDPDNFATKNQRSGFSIVEKQPGFLKYHLGMQIDKTDAPIIEAMIGEQISIQRVIYFLRSNNAP